MFPEVSSHALGHSTAAPSHTHALAWIVRIAFNYSSLRHKHLGYAVEEDITKVPKCLFSHALCKDEREKITFCAATTW